MLEAQAERLRSWVEKGGTLIAEACPAYFGDRGHVGQHQPNFGLDQMFGAREGEVEFMPDIGDRIHFSFDGKPVDGGGLLQSYIVTGGTARGWFDDGRISIVSHRHGAGRTLLVGTNPSVAYHQKASADNLRFFGDVFAWTGKEQMVSLTNPKLFARVHEGKEGRFLWLINPTREVQLTGLRLASRFGAVQTGGLVWPEGAGCDGSAPFAVGARDALILKLG
jgi:beta-galactosidase